MARLYIVLIAFVFSCHTNKVDELQNSYGKDRNFLKKYDNTIVELTRPNGEGRILLSSKYQGRVMTSTSSGLDGASYGWINYDLIESRKVNPRFNPVGGEERFWLGPEGGQFSLYFPQGDSFKISNWRVPGLIDTVTWRVTSKSDTSATFEARAQLINYSGTRFDIAITRTVELLRNEEIASSLGSPVADGEKFVAYRSTNTITNTGSQLWTRETGLISIWLLGMLTPSESAVVIIPLPSGVNMSMINTDYFGEIPPDRVSINGTTLLFKCDGMYRSKIGLPPEIASSNIGSYDSEKGILTIVRLRVDTDKDYVNSKWELQDEPFKGDAINSYNDGPLADGSQLGPFYELESSSPALALQPGEAATYSQVTYHFEGDFESLNRHAKAVLRFDLNDLKNQR